MPSLPLDPAPVPAARRLQGVAVLVLAFAAPACAGVEGAPPEDGLEGRSAAGGKGDDLTEAAPLADGGAGGPGDGCESSSAFMHDGLLSDLVSTLSPAVHPDSAFWTHVAVPGALSGFLGFGGEMLTLPAFDVGVTAERVWSHEPGGELRVVLGPRMPGGLASEPAAAALFDAMTSALEAEEVTPTEQGTWTVTTRTSPLGRVMCERTTSVTAAEGARSHHVCELRRVHFFSVSRWEPADGEECPGL